MFSIALSRFVTFIFLSSVNMCSRPNIVHLLTLFINDVFLNCEKTRGEINRKLKIWIPKISQMEPNVMTLTFFFSRKKKVYINGS